MAAFCNRLLYFISVSVVRQLEHNYYIEKNKPVIDDAVNTVVLGACITYHAYSHNYIAKI